MLHHEITESIKRVEQQLHELMNVLNNLKEQQKLIQTSTPIKAIEPLETPLPIPLTGLYLGKYEAENISYQLELDRIYKGQIRPVERVLPNSHASILHYCAYCGQDFYGSRKMLTGKPHLHHRCTMPYGDSRGERLKYVSSNKSKKKGIRDTVHILERFEELLWNDYSPEEIGRQLGLSPTVVRDYFIEEGLI